MTIDLLDVERLIVKTRRDLGLHASECPCPSCGYERMILTLADEVLRLRAWKAERLSRFSAPLPEYKPGIVLHCRDTHACYGRDDDADD